MNKYRSLYNTTLSLLSNLLLVTGCFILCRFVFIGVNHHLFTDLTSGRLFRMFEGGLLFDISAILYTNVLYIFLMLLPLHYKEGKLYQKITKGIFVTTNLIVLIMNLMDTVYFQYTSRRTTASVFSEFKHEGNLGGIIGTELLNHWYLTLLAIAFGYALFKLYRKPATIGSYNYPAYFKLSYNFTSSNNTLKIYNHSLYYLVHFITFGIGIYLCICGMRGGFTGMVRPITLSNANQYVDRPIETGIVLNTPFSIFRTIGKKPFAVPQYFDKEKMEQLYSPVHMPTDSVQFRPMNVVVFILESFGKENSGFLNEDLDNGTYKGYTPFLDSLMREGLTFKYSFANGKKSIDGMPSVLSGIPMFVEPFFVTPASLNAVSSIGGELKNKGYYTAFFHGADNGSMGFEAFSRTAGYTNYYGRTEYNNANPGNKDFDGHWGIWDEKFFQFFANTLTTFKQPFAAALFSLSSHHPFAVPAEYEGVFPKGNQPIRQCIGYSDHALKEFFETASKQPWFDNTLFVLTADHTNQNERPEYQTESGAFAVPVVFYKRGSDLKGYVKDAIAQQIDIMPTVLGYLGYDKPYVAFGCDLLNTRPEDTYAVNYINGIYQFFKGDYLLQFDGQKATAMYQFKTDKLLENNLLGQVPAQQQMENELKAMIQQYMTRMNNDALVVK